MVQPRDLAATFLSLAGWERDTVRRLMPGALDLTRWADESPLRDCAVCTYLNTGYGFGDPDTWAISSLAAFDNYLYASVRNTGGDTAWRSASRMLPRSSPGCWKLLVM